MKSPESLVLKKLISSAIVMGLAFSACSSASDSSKEAIISPSTTEDDGCETFGVYSQNRFAPYGTAIRKEPDVLSDKVGSFAPNEPIAVDGWYDSGAPIYPTNSAPWDSGVWFRLDYDNQEGWVSFPGVRAEPSSPDETGGFSEYGGEPVVLVPNCQIFVE